MVEKLLVLVHPDLGSTHAVGQCLAAGVRSLLGEDVSHVGTGVDLQAAATLPDLRSREEPVTLGLSLAFPPREQAFFLPS